MKIKHACGLLVLSVLCALLQPFPAQADGDVLEWVKIEKPGRRGNIVVRQSEVSEIAVGSRGVIYALDSENSVVYKSLNAGATWEDVTSRLVEAGAGLPFSKIAIAPDATGTVAVVTNSGTKVYLSTDGGSTWHDTNVPSLASTIQAIAISKQYTEDEESLREIAFGTAVWGDNTTTGQVWVLQLGLVSSWQNQSLVVDPSHVGGEVSAIAYSPSYQRDNTIIVVASTSTTDVTEDYQSKTWLCLGKRDTAAGTTSWNSDAFRSYDYPVEIAPAGDAPGVRLYSSLALPSNYSGREEDLRQLFVSYDRYPDANDDVYRLDDTTPYRLNANGGANINISSIAYYGTTTSGKLLAGDVSSVAGSATVRVRRTSNPFALPPTWQLATVPPSGPGNAKVSWSPEGDFAYSGTGQSLGDDLDESAFSMSSDGGDNWQQLSLMDTTIRLSDIAPAPDSKTLFAAIYSSSGPEGIWRSASTRLGLGEYWSRQLTMDTISNRIILRLSPDYASDYTIYAAEAGGNLMAVSHNRGNSWKRRLAPGAVIDIVVEDEDTLYAALSGGYIRKSTNSAFTWGEPVRTGLPNINMLAIAKKGTILVGGRNGEVAYSTDGGVSFTRIYEVIGGGDVQVLADTNYQENGIIYAATDAPDGGIWRWTIGISTSWEQIDKSITTLNTGQRIGGLAMGSEGTLYALRLEPASSTSGGMTRSLNPAAQYETEVEFDFINDALPEDTTFDSALVFTNTLPHLKLSGDAEQNDLWAIDTANPTNQIIYRFQDTLATVPPALSAPKSGTAIKVNPVSGATYNVSLSWMRPPEATKYEVQIALDAGFNEKLVLTGLSVESTSSTITYIATGDYLMPGTTYYWRVRSTEPIFSPYSEARSFTVEPLVALVYDLLYLLSPTNGAISVSKTPPFSWEPISGTTEYQFVLTDNAELISPIVDIRVKNAGFAMTEELDYGRTYFWKVRAVEPVESAWSTLANFTVKQKPIEPSPPVVVKEVPPPVINIPAPPPPSPEIVIPPSPPLPAPIAPAYIWAIVIIGAVLVIAVIVLIVRTGRPV